ncbi:hypothetical protein ACU686_39050 [Yinghuangia aomiensis]
MTRTSRAIRIPAPARRNTAFRRGRSLAATVVAGVLLAGCGGGDTPPTPGGTPKQGGSLTMTVPGDAASVDPAQTSFGRRRGRQPHMSAVYDALVVTDPATGTVQPADRRAGSSPTATTCCEWDLTIKPNADVQATASPYDASACRHGELRSRHRNPVIQFVRREGMAAMNIKGLNVDATNPPLAASP